MSVSSLCEHCFWYYYSTICALHLSGLEHAAAHKATPNVYNSYW